MNHRSSTLLAPLFAVLALLLGLAGSASAAFNAAATDPHYGIFLLQPSEAPARIPLEIADPEREIGVWLYDSTLGVPVYVNQNPWTKFDPEGLSAWSDFTGFWKGARNGAGNMAKGAASMAWNAHPLVNAGQYATGNKSGYQTSFESGMATAKAGYNLATSSQARSDAAGAIGNHLNAAFNDPEKFGELAFNVVTTAVTVGETGAALLSKVKAGTSLATTSARMTGAATKAEAAAAERGGMIDWVNEGHGNPSAYAYESGAPGHVSGKAPRLSATDAEGTVTAKFDGVDGGTMIDRKLSVTTFPKSERQMLRQSATAAENGYNVRWEVPKASEQGRAQKMAESLGVKNVEVKVTK